MDNGFLCFTHNSNEVQMAYALALSLKVTQPNVNNLTVVVNKGTKVTTKQRLIFDRVLEVSRSKVPQFVNGYSLAPYENTLQLTPDFLFVMNHELWWETLTNHQAVLTTVVRTYRGEEIGDSYYRSTFIDNKLPQLYSGMLFFKNNSPIAQQLFATVKLLYQKWEVLSEHYLVSTSRPKQPSVDVAFALAVKMLDITSSVDTRTAIPTYVDMRSNSQNWGGRGNLFYDENWKAYVAAWFDATKRRLMVGNHVQQYPFKYNISDFLVDGYIDQLEKEVGF